MNRSRCKSYLFAVLIASQTAWAVGDEDVSEPAPPSSMWQEAGAPYLQNFSPQDYQDTPQNWCIAQGENGVMYFGNYGVLAYDGVSWERITVNETAVRSLAAAHGRIYLGAQSDLGYLAASAAGQLRFFSLRDSIPPAQRDFQDVWRTFVLGDTVYFHTFNFLFRYANGSMKAWQRQERFHLAFAVHGALFVRAPKLGLMKMEADSLRLVPGGERFAEEPVLAMLPYDRSRILVATPARGFYLYDGTTFTPFPTAADAFLAANQLYRSVALPGGLFALGTLRGGVAIIDQHGNLCQIINKAAGLRDQRVHAPFASREGALWLALNNGLARVETPRPFSRFTAAAGLESTVEHLVRYRGRIYAATHRGVFVLHTDNAEAATDTQSRQAARMQTPAWPGFKPVPGVAPSHSWFLLNAGEHLLAATDDGVYQIDGRGAFLLKATWSGATCLLRSRQDTTLAFAGLFEGLAVLRKTGGRWVDGGRMQGIDEMIISIAEGQDGALWLGTQYEGVLRIDQASATLQAGELQAPVTRFNQEHGLPGTRVSAEPIAGRILFATQKGLRSFDAAQQRFVPNTLFGAAFADTSRWIFRMREDRNGNVWIIAGTGRKAIQGKAERRNNGSYLWHEAPFVRLRDLGDLFVIYPEPEGTVWFGGVEGIARYTPQFSWHLDAPFPVLIRRVSSIAPQQDTVFYHGAQRQPELLPELHAEFHSLRFECAAIRFEGEAANRYQFLLEGFEENWSDWTTESKKDYTGLNGGSYVFRVRAQDIYGRQSSEARFAFAILPPWYRTRWAYAGYLVLIAAGLFAVDRSQRSRLLKKERQKARLKEAELIRLKNSELSSKNEQLEKVLRDLRVAQTHLTRSESRFRSVAQSASDAIITTDSSGKIMFWNQRAQAIFGYSEHEALGRPLTMLMPQRYHKAHTLGLQRFFASGKQHILGRVVEMHALHKDGSEFPIELSVAAWETDEGKFVTGIIRDITKRKQAQEVLEQTQSLLAAENWRKSEELEKARQLQLAMLPQDLPQLPHLEIEAYMKTATEVGGDYYDFQLGNDGALTIVIGDATGHGLNAGMMVTATKSILVTLSPDRDLPSVFKHLNRALRRVNLHRHYMALQILRIKDRHLEVCSAGMPPLLLYRAVSKTIEEMAQKAMPLGSSYEFPYQIKETALAPGDVILAMSDGLPEMFNAQGEIFDYARAKTVFQAAAQEAPGRIIEQLVQAGEAWAGERPQADDVTFVAVRVRENASLRHDT